MHFCSSRLYIGEARLIAGREQEEEGEARRLLMTVHHHVI